MSFFSFLSLLLILKWKSFPKFVYFLLHHHLLLLLLLPVLKVQTKVHIFLANGHGVFDDEKMYVMEFLMRRCIMAG
ncbi:hypothetical protein AQUCO_01600209v1 [Aquilegia coerulea]|uniref:Uncharacterized protein n=1 Tax=Aquilegia coerulea TaxID=218851 RepID=A0A2G5DQL3_AQUCA|nr:hypothetical protein AQUCO_01600209v1 [Aquilegia coerulea]PIA45811.1 hypothetical protein AQUCO_01600209v1 [Aquilegia coerulea]